MSSWRKCRSCSRVLATTEFDEEDQPQTCSQCKGDPTRRTRLRPAGASTESVRRYREKTGNAYGKAYAKARAEAVKRLIDLHPETFRDLLSEERRKVALGPTREA